MADKEMPQNDWENEFLPSFYEQDVIKFRSQFEAIRITFEEDMKSYMMNTSEQKS